MIVKKAGEYRMRNGRKAIVCSANGTGEQPILGCMPEVAEDGKDVAVRWFSNGSYLYSCQSHVYDIVDVWQEAIVMDAGDGWRVLENDEPLKAGDEVWDVAASRWVRAWKPETNGRHPLSIYRRRETKYVPYTWEDREQLRGRWFRYKKSGTEASIVNMRFEHDVFYINDFIAEAFLTLCEWLDGTPCGKVVQ